MEESESQLEERRGEDVDGFGSRPGVCVLVVADGFAAVAVVAIVLVSLLINNPGCVLTGVVDAFVGVDSAGAGGADGIGADGIPSASVHELVAGTGGNMTIVGPAERPPPPPPWVLRYELPLIFDVGVVWL